MTLFNRGKTPNRPVPGESEEQFQDRIAKASFIKGDRTNIEVRGGGQCVYDFGSSIGSR